MVTRLTGILTLYLPEPLIIGLFLGKTGYRSRQRATLKIWLAPNLNLELEYRRG
jgi:hypothetical protein